MSVRGLRTKIAINIAILLFLGMFLINLVTMVTAKRDLIRSEVRQAGSHSVGSLPGKYLSGRPRIQFGSQCQLDIQFAS